MAEENRINEEQLANLNRPSLTDAVIDLVKYGEANNMSPEDIANTVGISLEKTEPEIDVDDSSPDGLGIEEFANLKSRGGPIPGQSLTNSPDNPYPWERPPEFANPKDALNDVVKKLLKPEGMKAVVKSLGKGVTVEDVTNLVVYNGFTQGKYTPDTMLLIYEPVMYTVLAIGERANINYKLDDDTGNNYDNTDEDKLQSTLSGLKKIKQQVTSKGLEQTSLPSDLVEEVKTKTKSLLAGDKDVVS
tara:strand:- start:1001 stop:1738 length:738 start_codon:yes stop_codon:yes gene_type:complete